MKLKNVDLYRHQDAGYDPYLITPGWQVAQLNYDEPEALGNIKRLDVHHETDEAFYMMEGKAVLVGAEIHGDQIQYDPQIMVPGVVYNIRKEVWHTIVMLPGARVLIIENADTHLNDCEFHYFTEEQKADFVEEVTRVLESAEGS